MRSSWIIAVAMIAALGLTAGCSSDKSETSDDGPKGDIVAQVGDWTVSTQQLENALTQLPEHQRAKYQTRAGRAELIDKMIAEELYHLEGLDKGLADDPGIQEAMAAQLRGLVITEYFKRYVEPLASPSEEDMYQYYEKNQDAYTKMPIVRAQHIFSTSREMLVDLRKRIEAGEKMTALAMTYSEDEQTRGDGGDLGFFNPDGYIRGIGYSKEISEAAFTLTPGVVSDPIKWEKGYSLLRVSEARPAELRPYDEVKEDIRRVFASRRIEEVKREVQAQIIVKYEVHNFLAQDLSGSSLTDEESWNRAQASSDPYQRLRLYEDIVTRYPNSKYAPDALFMIGFVYAEEIKDVVEADRAFNQVVNKYPDSKIARTAEWMLQNLNQPLPSFEDLDDLNRQIEEK